MTSVRRVLASALLVLGAATGAEAQNSCTITSTSVVFPNYSVFSAAPTDSTGTITYRCLLPVAVAIDLSRGSSSTYTPRRMVNGTSLLDYNLFRDATRTTIWGDGSPGTGRYSATAPTNTNVTLVVYGRIAARLDVSAGTYTDTIVATITF